MIQHPIHITHMVASKPKNAIILQEADQLHQGIVADKASAVVTFFRPRVCKQRNNPSENRVSQNREKLSHVVVKNADIGETATINQTQNIGDAINEGLTPNKPDIRVSRGLGGKMFAATESDFEP